MSTLLNIQARAHTVQAMFRDRSQTLVRGGPDAKRGALKIFDPCKGGGPEKNYHRFSIKSLHAFLWGCPVIFMAKRGP